MERVIIEQRQIDRVVNIAISNAKRVILGGFP
jgi:hypothetical protein